jgi:hypothetical protein
VCAGGFGYCRGKRRGGAVSSGTARRRRVRRVEVV